MKDGAEFMARTFKGADPVILVLERDPLIAEDIVGSIGAVCECRVVHASHLSDFLAKLVHEAHVVAAFLEMRLSKVLESGLDGILAQRGAGIVLTVGEDDEQQAQERGWGMLVRPFSDQMIGNALFSVARPDVGCLRLP
ncbi:hypothetical protein [Marinovum sp.]|uniref:hypothetical protein n=1 Tax=Marinovum sp. TaxID=2024839 RepID=UPI002B270BB0|nr:hypothetical protein [Marinovum sp.]